ncbi:hypothetical protein FNV43_RR04548 [Rhamnella rubrinervis]|uniref:Uncharacterized protein n=1 Tax=Rhamnella rubrinervis TaxID=2594499 RepID=A0A8K0MPN5_9ROSA|nr:hypothetical protein FNV43_RR04548 [Rhamnella rubrinervis]
MCMAIGINTTFTPTSLHTSHEETSLSHKQLRISRKDLIPSTMLPAGVSSSILESLIPLFHSLYKCLELPKPRIVPKAEYPWWKDGPTPRPTPTSPLISSLAPLRYDEASPTQVSIATANVLLIYTVDASENFQTDDTNSVHETDSVYNWSSSKHLVDRTNLMMAEPTTQSIKPVVEKLIESTATHSIPTSSRHLSTLRSKYDGIWFFFESLPCSQWRTHMHEFSAWIDNYLADPTIPFESVLKEFSSCFIGTLHYWFQSHDQSSQRSSSISITAIQDPFSKCSHLDLTFKICSTYSGHTMVNPKFLPPDAWKPHVERFKATDDEIFETHLIPKNPLGLSFSLNVLFVCKYWVVSFLTRTLLLTCMFTIRPSSYASYLMEFGTKCLRLCTDNHYEFKHPHPSWKNSEFFLKLPFKLNENMNPTKATHVGMNLSNLALARAEYE